MGERLGGFMTELLDELAKIIDLHTPTDGLHESPVPGVLCLKFSQTDARTKRHHRACLGILVQGCKEIILGRDVYIGDAGHYALTPIDLPVISRVAQASPEKPFLCLLLAFDPLIVHDIASQIERDLPKEIEDTVRGVFFGKAGAPMLDAARRLAKLFQSPDDAPVLGPLVLKEIFYHLLKGADGPAIRQFVRSGSKTHQISQAIHILRSELKEDIDVDSLAKKANMSRSAFFKHFKDVTAMSPIQYQKRLRLLEARRLMTDDGETAERSAFMVGYNSPSQFSREYSRMFGDPPFRNATKLKQLGHPIHEI